jgi:hypothetical protein
MRLKGQSHFSNAQKEELKKMYEEDKAYKEMTMAADIAKEIETDE